MSSYWSNVDGDDTVRSMKSAATGSVVVVVIEDPDLLMM